MPNELAGRFSSKSDFVRYFRDQSKWVPLLEDVFVFASATVLAAGLDAQQRLRDPHGPKVASAFGPGQTGLRAAVRRALRDQTVADAPVGREVHAVLPEEAGEGPRAGPGVLLRSTRSSRATCSRSSNTPTASATRPRPKPWRSRSSRSRTTGGTPSTRVRSCPVSFLCSEH